MIIAVGSTNDVKVNAVREVAAEYPVIANAEVRGFAASSRVSEQPKSLEETVCGAMNRARHAFQACDASIGIESGLMRVPHTKTGYMDVCACAIYDGSEFHLGLSSAFECPKEVTDLMINEGLDMNQAFNRVGLTTDPKLGAHEGAIGVLTGGRVTRKDYTKQALRMAFIHLERSAVSGNEKLRG